MYDGVVQPRKSRLASSPVALLVVYRWVVLVPQQVAYQRPPFLTYIPFTKGVDIRKQLVNVTQLFAYLLAH